jgi:hypothetical protein
VVEIRDDKDMPKDNYGIHVDIVMDPTSIPGRMNIGNLYEQYFNSVSRHTKYIITNKMKELNEDLSIMTDSTVSKLFTIVLGLLDIIDTEQAIGYHKADKHQKREILKEIVEKELYLYYKISSKKKPYQIVLEIHGTMYEPPNSVIDIGKDGKPVWTKNKVMVGPQYVILLAKTPENFLSTASAKTNHYGLPVGVGAKTRNRLPWRNSPVKIISETESRLYASYVGPVGLAELKDRANSIPTHACVYKNILNARVPTNIDYVIDRRKVPYGNDSAIQFIDNIVNAAGMEIVYCKDTTKEHPTIK